MMKGVNALVGVMIGWLLASCVTDYQPAPVSTAPSLVVEGQITDQPGPYIVRLSRTADYTLRSLNLLETGATVSIEDDQGTKETLTEQPPGGVYQTRANGIRGVAGRSYKLVIQTKAGKRYESDAELLRAAPPILKLYTEYRNEPGLTPALRKQSWDVYLDTKDPEAPGNFYRWDWTHYEAVFACRKTLLSSGLAYTGISCCTPCWDITRCYNCISVSSDVNINGQAISRQYIMTAPYTSTNPYYVEVQQQAISKGAYEFWKSVKQLVNNTGGLFDAAPASIRGNVHALTNPNEGVYGYFGATGLSEQYLYIDRSNGQGKPDLDLPVNIPFPTNPACVVCENSLYRTPNKPRWWVY